MASFFASLVQLEPLLGAASIDGDPPAGPARAWATWQAGPGSHRSLAGLLALHAAGRRLRLRADAAGQPRLSTAPADEPPPLTLESRRGAGQPGGHRQLR